MARLNEPPNESVESLKRRFIRQNRELARNNSTQSVKIRSLETQISQLVAENVSLRTNVIQLQSELDDAKSHHFAANVDSVKKKLEDKLADLQSLLRELDVTKPVKPRQKPDPKSPRLSPTSKPWRDSTSIGDIVAGREGWLPTIVEDKHFPRKTLEPNDIHISIPDQSSDSPEIGPPPRCSVDDKISHDVEDKPLYNEPDISTDGNNLTGLLSVNMEMRRRRRDTHVRRDSGDESTQPNSPTKESKPASSKTPDLWNSQPVRAGSKRKLDVANRPGGDENSIIKPKEGLDFAKPSDSNTHNISPSRKVLAPKSVNSDPTSPKKPGSTGIQIERQSSSSINSNSNTSNRSSATQRAEVLDSLHNAAPSPVAIKTEAKTPAPPLDLFSPPSTDHADIRQQGRGDTPPPPTGLTSKSAVRKEETLSGRESRRARAHVSYAEPSLVSKMRRPTKDLVDAVTYDRSRSLSFAPSEIKQEEPSEPTSDLPAVKTVHIKREQHKEAENSTSKQIKANLEPQSPLSKKDKGNSALINLKDQPATILTEATSTGPNNAVTDGSEIPDKVARRRQSAAHRRSSRPTQSISEPKLDNAPAETGHDSPDIYDLGPSPPRRFVPVSKSKSILQDQDTRSNLATSAPTTGNYTKTKPQSFQNESNSGISSASNDPNTLNRPRSRRQTVGTDTNTKVERASKSSSSSSSTRNTSVEGIKSTARSTTNPRTVDKNCSETAGSNIAARRRSMML